MKKIITFFVFISLIGNALAQQTFMNVQPISKWTYGGNIGLSVGDNSWGISIAPRLGYLITNDLELSGEVNYTYQNYNTYKSSLLGIGPSLNYYLQRNFYLRASYQHYFIFQKSKYSDDSLSLNEAALYIGGGYLQRLGDRAFIQIGGMYNILYKKDKSIFSTGFVPNVGFVIGL